MLEIPLTVDGEQEFDVPLNGVKYNFRVIYNTRLGIWSMDIALQGVELISGVALVIGANLLARYNLPLSRLFMVNVLEGDADATADNLGSGVRLFVLTAEELEDAQAI